MTTAEKATILVVDDTPDNLTIMSNLLEEKYNVKVANRGEKALKIARSDSQPDLILLDIMMPEMDGYEVCRQLKADSKTADIPVIFLTAKNEAEDEIFGFTLGAVDYMTKPIQAEVTLARIERHLAIKAAQDKQREKVEQLRKQLFHSQKINSLGQMTEGVAHEFNNIMCNMLGYSEMSKMMLGDFPDSQTKQDLAENFESIGVGIRRATTLIDKMFIYCNQHNLPSENGHFDVKPLNDVLDEVLTELNLKDKTRVELAIADNIKVDSAILKQILTNVLDNARYAIKHTENGHIEVSLNFAQPAANSLFCASCAGEIFGKYLELAIADNGTGIDEKTLTNIFDPFFTTKEVGEGVGLGLSVVSGYMHHARGHIFAESKIGQGSTFKLFFPVAA